MHSIASHQYDIIIIGARCAGAATGLLLARSGARVLIVERDRPGADTMSTHALMRGALFQLAKWGLLQEVAACGASPIRSASFHYAREEITIGIRPMHGTDALYAPRRFALDTILARAAESAGADVAYSTSAVDVLRSPLGAVCGLVLQGVDGTRRSVTAPLVIGADGRRSWLARQVRAALIVQAASTTRLAYVYASGLANRGYRWFYDVGAGGGLIPTNDGETAVFIALTPGRTSVASRAGGVEEFASQIGERLPVMADALSGAVMNGAPIVFGGAPGFMRAPCGPGWALVGDSAYFKDPLTAHGITDAFRDAELLARAILANRLHDYPEARDDLSRDLFRATERIAALDWTLDELKDLHANLNKAMKLTQGYCASGLESGTFDNSKAFHMHVAQAARAATNETSTALA